MGKKRGNGEGTICQRKDGKWCAAISLPGGKRSFLYGKTRAEVAKKLREAQSNRDQGLPVVPDRITVADFLDRWLTDTMKTSVRPSTHASYKRMVDRHIKPAIGHIRLARLTPADVQGLLNGL